MTVSYCAELSKALRNGCQSTEIKYPVISTRSKIKIALQLRELDYREACARCMNRTGNGTDRIPCRLNKEKSLVEISSRTRLGDVVTCGFRSKQDYAAVFSTTCNRVVIETSHKQLSDLICCVGLSYESLLHRIMSRLNSDSLFLGRLLRASPLIRGKTEIGFADTGFVHVESIDIFVP